MSHASAPPIVVGIHGLENKPPLDEKLRWWRSAIGEGLRRNCGRMGEAPFEFVYWADLRYAAPLGPDENDEPYFPDEADGPFPACDPEAAEPGKTIVGRIYDGIQWIETKTGIATVDDLILERQFDDLWHYQSETRFAQDVRRRLCDRLRALRGRDVLLVAHSMGSIIAYDSLRMLERESPDIRIGHFVTLGSPLGLANVRLKIAAENGAARVPNNVGAWTNFADARDKAAIAGALADDFRPNDRGVAVADQAVVNGYRTPGGAANPHKSYGYLRAPEFSRLADAFLGREAASRSATASAARAPSS